MARAEPDAHGQAAFLLAESMLHMLVETGTFTTGQAMEAVEIASEVKVDVAAQTGESSARMNQSLALLATVSRSLGNDAA